jgi:hypothetical protein
MNTIVRIMPKVTLIILRRLRLKVGISMGEMMSKLQKESLSVFIFSLIMFFSVLVVMQKSNKKKECNRVMAYIPVKGKWIEKDICLEGLK